MELGRVNGNQGSPYRASRPTPNGNAFCEPNPEVEVRSDFEDAWQRILSEPPNPGNGTMPAHWTLHEGGWYFYQQNLLLKRQAEANITKLVK